MYEEVAAAFEHQKDNLVIAKVDADAHKELATRFGIQGFPTFKWFGKGSKEATDAEVGGRSFDDFVAFLRAQTGKSTSLCITA